MSSFHYYHVYYVDTVFASVRQAQCETWHTWPNPVVPLWGKGYPQQFSIWVVSWLLFLHLPWWCCTFSAQRLWFVSRWLLVYLFFLCLEGSCTELVLWCCFWVASECVLSNPIFVPWWCLWWMTGLFLSIILSCWSSLAIWFVECVAGICLRILAGHCIFS